MGLIKSACLGLVVGAAVSVVLCLIMILFTNSSSINPNIGLVISRATLAFWPAGYGFAQGAEGLGFGSPQYLFLLAITVALNSIIYAVFGGLVWAALHKTKLLWIVIAVPIAFYWHWALLV